MQKTILMIVAVALVGCGTTSWVSDPSDENNVKIEKAIRKYLKKPTGELTKADLEKVTRLSLYENQLTEVPKGLEKLTQLKELSLDDNQLTDVKSLEKLTQLEVLKLGGNQLTSVKGLEKLIQLEILYLDNNQLTDVKGLEKLTKLKVLKLGGNQLTSVKGLEKLTQLLSLSIGSNKLTDVKAQIAELKKALPICQIFSNPTKYPPSFLPVKIPECLGDLDARPEQRGISP